MRRPVVLSEQRFALRGKVERRGIAGLRRHGRTPFRQKFPHLAFIFGIANRRRVGDPQVDLKSAIALVPELPDPIGDPVG
jgi:hypothetical protein